MARRRLRGLGVRSELVLDGVRAKRGRRWVPEGLEDRILLAIPAAIYTVDLTTDTGASTGVTAGDLLYCITQANANPSAGGSEIQFDPTVFNATSPQTIDLTGVLNLTETPGPEVIDGPGASALTISGQSTTQAFSVAAGTTASLADLTITGGVAVGNGGAIDNSGTLSLTSVAVTGNAAASGGGVENEATGTLSVTGSTFNSNTATGTGGGIDNAGTLTVTNSTIAFNSATSGGGGVSSEGPVTFISATIADNSTVSGGSGAGLSLTSGGSAAIYDTIVAQNDSGAGQAAIASDIVASGGGSLAPSSANNLIGVGGSGGLVSGGFTNNLVGIANPGLDTALKSNGGLTQTIALLAGSPAIDGGSSAINGVDVPNVDQRGALRGPTGSNAGTTIDIGAYGASSTYLVSTTADTADTGTIASAVAWANQSTNQSANPNAPLAPNTIVFDPGVFGTQQTITLTGTLTLDNPTTPIAVVGPVTGMLTISGGNSVGVFSVAGGASPTVATLTGLTISGGLASSGGGVDNSGSLSLVNDTFTGNSAATGAAVANEATGTLTVTDSTFTSNTATASGGAIANATGGQATVTNTTIAGNSAPLGAGIFSAGTLTLMNATVAYNAATTANGGGGLDAVTAGTATVFNSIVAQNTAGAVNAPNNINGVVASTSSNNVIDDATTAGGLTNGTQGNIIGLPAGLAAGLASNGGSTQTIALLASSPALDAGAAVINGFNVPTTDQRGAIRVPTLVANVPMIDAGAFQVSASYLVTSTADSLVAGTLRSAVIWANNNVGQSPNSVQATISFDPTVFATPQTINLSDALGTLTVDALVNVTIQGPGSALLTIAGDGTFELLSVAPGANATLSGLTLSGGANLTQSGGGAVPQSGGGAILNQGTLDISNSVLSNNQAVYYGGAIYNQGGTLNVSFTTFSNNTAEFGLGGAIDNSGTLNVANSTFTGGDAFDGGAIDNKAGGTLTVITSTFDSNTAVQGGSIFNGSINSTVGANATITGSTFSNNIAFQGGAIANDLLGTMMLENSTVADNTAGQNGGGINQVGILTTLNSTIAYNNVADGGAGGGIDASAGTTTLYNTIVAGNTTGAGTTTTGTGTTTTGTGTTTTGTSTTTTGTGATSTVSDVSGIIGPLSLNNLIGGLAADDLGQLADNGGPTETVALLKGSPAIDGGAMSFPVSPGVALLAPTLDQRGALRGPAGLNAGTTVDIGSYEATSSYQVSSTADTAADIGTLRSAVSWADNNQNFNPANIKTPEANTILFTTTGSAITLGSGALVLSNLTTSTSINGPGAGAMTISAGGASRVFEVESGVTAVIMGLTITGGSAIANTSGQTGLGGGIDNFGNLQLSSVVLTGNSATAGGGLANEAGATLAVDNSTVSDNSATTGGGIYNAGMVPPIAQASLAVNGSTVSNNSAITGAGIYNGGLLSLVNSTLALNSASGQGGGVANAGTMTSVSSTIADNLVTTAGSGGGIMNVAASPTNSAGSVSLYDTIVAQNTATTPTAFDDIAGTVAPASSFNVIGSAGSGNLTSANSNLIVKDSSAGLGALANNGGTTLTIALLLGSPAIGAGNPTITGLSVPTIDQRGIARPATAIDIGAYQTTGTSSPLIVTLPIETVTPPVIKAPLVVTAQAAPIPVVTVPPLIKTTGKVKIVASKKAHPGTGSAANFRKPAKAAKASHHFAIVKAHPAAHAKKK